MLLPCDAQVEGDDDTKLNQAKPEAIARLIGQFLYGGYCKRKEDDDVGVGQMEKGTVHSDMWALDLNTYKWDKVKKAGMPPGQRAGFTMAGD